MQFTNINKSNNPKNLKRSCLYIKVNFLSKTTLVSGLLREQISTSRGFNPHLWQGHIEKRSYLWHQCLSENHDPGHTGLAPQSWRPFFCKFRDKGPVLKCLRFQKKNRSFLVVQHTNPCSKLCLSRKSQKLVRKKNDLDLERFKQKTIQRRIHVIFQVYVHNY